jgi:hypothetical protein
MQLVTEAIKKKLSTGSAPVSHQAPPAVEALQTDFAVPAETGDLEAEASRAEAAMGLDFQPSKGEDEEEKNSENHLSELT